MTGTIYDNVRQVRAQIAGAAERAGRNADEVCIVGVSKTQPIERIREAIKAGITDIGENRVQEARQKHRDIQQPVRWHLVGHLQTNKIKQALEIFELIHSVDSLRLVQEIDRQAVALHRQVDVLIQVNTSGESSKFGIPPDEILAFVEQALAYPHVKISGLMTIGAFLPNPEAVRPSFVLLRQIRDKVTAQRFPNIEMKHLSMGMTNDFEVAVEEGATLVRIGTAIFGARA